MTLKNNRAPLLGYIKLCTLFQSISKFKLELQSGNAQFRLKLGIFCPLWAWNLMDDLQKQLGTSSMPLQASHPFIAIGRFKQELQSRNTKFGSKSAIWWMTLENNKAPYLTYFKLCASLHGHRSMQTRVTVRKCQIRVKIGDFLSCVTLKFDRWPWKRIQHLFYATSSFSHHFIAIGQFELELQSGKAKFWSKSVIFLSRMTLKFDRLVGSSPAIPWPLRAEVVFSMDLSSMKVK